MTASNASSPGEPLPYRETTDDSYTELAVQSFTVEELESGILVLRGPCPRCRAQIEVPVVTSIFEGLRAKGHPLLRRPKAPRDYRGTPEGNGIIEPMMCTCEDEHPNRPRGRKGCGAYWTLRVMMRSQ